MKLIENWSDKLPSNYRNESAGINKETMMSKLFRALIVAPSGAGKTNLVFDIIKKSPNVYNHLHICARNPDQPLYNFIGEKLKDFCTIYESGEIPNVDDVPTDGLQLFIFDDYSNDMKIQTERIVPYFIRGRHKKFSSLFLSHAYFSGTAKMIRLNVEYIMILKVPSRRDLDMVLKDITIENCDKNTLFRLYKEATVRKGQFLMCDTLKSELRFNFDHPIVLEKKE